MVLPAVSFFQPVGAQAGGAVARQAGVIHIRHAVLLLVLLGRLLRIDSPPAGQILADQNDADGAPDVGDAVAEAIMPETASAVLPSGSL